MSNPPKLPINTKSWLSTFTRWGSELRSYDFITAGDFLNSWTTYDPTYPAAMTFTSTVGGNAEYLLIPDTDICFVRLYSTGTIGGVVTSALEVSMPFQPKGDSNQFYGLVDSDGTGTVAAFCQAEGSSREATFFIRRYDRVNWTAGTPRIYNIQGWYRILT